MKINRAGYSHSSKAPAESFTDTVCCDALIGFEEPARVSTSLVTSEPGARTALRTHPPGQILLITAGKG